MRYCDSGYAAAPVMCRSPAGSSLFWGSSHCISDSESAAGEGGLLTSPAFFVTSSSLADSGKAVNFMAGSGAINGFWTGFPSPSTSLEVSNKLHQAKRARHPQAVANWHLRAMQALQP
ncbi:UNVERIFIED_CONTAM: hypothetical protein FKN15_076284 [Acipenser sinensis]